jgi:hypothetical protein
VLLWWGHALIVEEMLKTDTLLNVTPLSGFLPVPADVIQRRLDAPHLAWILSGVLDEWYGMWAPQAFSTERIAALLQRLTTIAPGAPVTKFLTARWLMQSRGFDSAAVILRELAVSGNEGVMPFPIVGKWIRPPWSSVRKKATLNLAFVHDYQGRRDSALVLYEELLADGNRLNDEARAAGYVYDDIRAVIESYTRKPYTGMPEEAFRHLRLTAQIPGCAPDESRKQP